MKSVDNGSIVVKVSPQTKNSLDRIKKNVPWVARVRSYDDAIQWLISHLDSQGINEMKDH